MNGLLRVDAKNLLSSPRPFFVRHGYAILFLGVALENAGLLLPGEAFLFAAGFLASKGLFKLPLVIALGGAGAMVGDNLSYLLGRLGGERLPQLYCKLTLGSADCVRKTNDYFTRRGGLTVAFARFVVGVRAFAAPMAGSTGMAYHRFLAYDALGAFLWAGFAGGLRLSLRKPLGTAPGRLPLILRPCTSHRPACRARIHPHQGSEEVALRARFECCSTPGHAK